MGDGRAKGIGAKRAASLPTDNYEPSLQRVLRLGFFLYFVNMICLYMFRHKEAGKKIHPHTARQAISKARLGLLPNVPDLLKDLPRVIVNFPEEYKKCYFRSFFTENNKVGVIFTSQKLLEAIGHFDTSEIYIDGTFNARPKKPTSAQLLVVQIKKRNMVRRSGDVRPVRG
ncbi:hypothetical protein PV325_011597 [Microctonus aethiopoides]|nr:hypothetical protein PV325_011597 [Microctonus aethiopoides]